MSIKGYATHRNGKSHPVHERKGIRENQFGKGAKVRVIRKFGINDVPVGSEGIVVEHFGKDRTQPVVAFSGRGRRVLAPDIIEVIKPSNIFEPTKHDIIKVYGSKKELMQKLRENKYNGIGEAGSDFVYKYKYLDDGEGHSVDVPYYVKVKENAVEVHLNKKDVPKRWQYDFDGIKEEIINEVESDLGVTR